MYHYGDPLPNPYGPRDMHYDGYFLGEAHGATIEDMYRDIDDDPESSADFGHNTRRAVYNQFFKRSVPSQGNLPPDELHLAFGTTAVTGRDIHKLAARAAFCSTRSYLITPYSLKRTRYPDPSDSMSEDLYTLEISSDFIRLVIELKPYILDGCIDVLPKSAYYANAPSARYPGSEEDEASNVDNSEILNVLLHEDVSVVRELQNVPALKFSFQTIAGAQGVDLLKVRSEHQEGFQAIQRELVSMIAAGPRFDESVLAQAIQAIEYRTQSLGEQLRRLQRQNWFETMRLRVAPLPMIMPLLFPQALRAVVASAARTLGESEVVEHVEYTAGQRDIRGEVENDPFFVPWRLHP